MPRVYTKKIKNAAPLFLISHYSFRKTMPDKKGNSAGLAAILGYELACTTFDSWQDSRVRIQI